MEKRILTIFLITLIILTMIPATFAMGDGILINIYTTEKRIHMTEITVYNLCNNSYMTNETCNEIEEVTIHKNETISLAVNLYMNNNSQAFRWIRHEIRDINGNLERSGRKQTKVQARLVQKHNRKPIFYYIIGLKGLDIGDYTCTFRYDGNLAERWLPTTKTIKIHVTPNINSTLTTNSTPNINSTLTT